MARLSTSLMLFCLLGSTLAVAREPYDQETQNVDATCDVSNYHACTWLVTLHTNSPKYYGLRVANIFLPH